MPQKVISKFSNMAKHKLTIQKYKFKYFIIASKHQIFKNISKYFPEFININK